MTEEEIRSALKEFIEQEFLPDDEHAALTETTPLVESGVLDSLRIAVLLGFIRDRLGLAVPLARIDARTFADIGSIARVLIETAEPAAREGARG
ncbi:acyl carrier protein [Streptomyces sp. 4503]|uniref:Acyl carrier protein n=1 Tax=Streptomyces niphimycinicus TaxID=2842201 RepID=A0ABS6C8J9_9ACTN|nr:phosphopantetheine-binding protein [Streptomyces niphimycinicus]MBU3863226.1 acyl carrier protein [Streptomyces niphimycinicus]